MLIMMTTVFVIGILIGFLVSPVAGIVILLSGLAFCGSSILFTVRRYKDIEKLSGYLRRIYSGDYSMDIRDNTEGELSILKNEIYKVTLILSKQAQALKTEKEQLADAISDISHQLKTPLTSMTVMTDLLSKDNLTPEKRKEFIKNQEQQLKRMEWLLTSLLKLAKLDAGTVPFKSEPIVVKELINQVMKPLLIPMELKEQRLTIEGEVSVAFLGDRNWTTEALINIIKNCIEHTPVGGEISVSYEENPIYTQIMIRDNGVGIDKEDIPYIFKRFYKGKNAGEDSVGIGLAMAYSIITSQGGDISVTSKKLQGSCFCVKFYKQRT
jgi:signal transduction histidine kinase